MAELNYIMENDKKLINDLLFPIRFENLYYEAIYFSGFLQKHVSPIVSNFCHEKTTRFVKNQMFLTYPIESNSSFSCVEYYFTVSLKWRNKLCSPFT